MTTKALVLRFLESVQAGSGWEDILADDLQFTNYTEPVKRISGKQASLVGIRRFYGMVKTMEVESLIVDGERACAQTRYQLQPPGGAAFESHIAEVFQVQDGRIQSFGIYFDSAPYPRPPAANSAARTFDLAVERTLKLSSDVVYQAWTEGFDRWFADPGSVVMRPEVNAPFFFETVFRATDQSSPQRHPHYGRFLELQRDRVVELTWVTGEGGTEGAETIVRVELEPASHGSHLRLTHRGFPNQQARDRHAEAWPQVLEHMERRLAGD